MSPPTRRATPPPEATVLDRTLVARALAGDRGAFEAVIAATAPRLRALLEKLDVDEQDVDDVVNDVYLRLWAKRWLVDSGAVWTRIRRLARAVVQARCERAERRARILSVLSLPRRVRDRLSSRDRT